MWYDRNCVESAVQLQPKPTALVVISCRLPFFNETCSCLFICASSHATYENLTHCHIDWQWALVFISSVTQCTALIVDCVIFCRWIMWYICFQWHPHSQRHLRRIAARPRWTCAAHPRWTWHQMLCRLVHQVMTSRQRPTIRRRHRQLQCAEFNRKSTQTQRCTDRRWLTRCMCEDQIVICHAGQKSRRSWSRRQIFYCKSAGSHDLLQWVVGLQRRRCRPFVQKAEVAA